MQEQRQSFSSNAQATSSCLTIERLLSLFAFRMSTDTIFKNLFNRYSDMFENDTDSFDNATKARLLVSKIG